MSTGPNQPQPQNSPELQRGLEVLWSNILKPDPATGRLTKEVRKTIENALGADKLSQILQETGSAKNTWNPLDRMKEPVVQAYAMQRICREMAETRAGFFHHIHEQEHDPKTKATRRIMWPPFVYGDPPLTWPIGNVISDPDTKEADALFWLYSQLSNSGNVHTLIPIFEQVTEVETKDAEILVKMQQLHNEIIGDEDYFEIGEEGKVNRTSGKPGTPAVPGVPGSKGSAPIAPIPAILPIPAHYELDAVITGCGFIARTQDMRCEYLNAAEDEAIRDKGDPKPDRDEARKCLEKIDLLKKKQKTLKVKLAQMNAFAQTLSSKPAQWTNADITDLSKEFSPDYLDTLIPDYSTTEIELGDVRKPISQWVGDKELPVTKERITKRYRMAGTGAPPASLALDDLIRTYFGARLTGTPQAEQDQFYSNMRTILLSAEHGHAGAAGGHKSGAHRAAPAAPGSHASGGHSTPSKKKGGGFWDFITRDFR